MHRTAAFILSLLAFSGSAHAADALSTPKPTTAEQLSVVDVDWSLPPVEISPERRPRILPALYLSFAALQVFDAYSTRSGLASGAREANPLMAGISRNAAAFWTVKAASTAGSIWVAERLWKTNRVGAIVTMVVINGVAASVAARNAAVLKAVR
jgi:hypothetical protein